MAPAPGGRVTAEFSLFRFNLQTLIEREILPNMHRLGYLSVGLQHTPKTRTDSDRHGDTARPCSAAEKAQRYDEPQAQCSVRAVVSLKCIVMCMWSACSKAFLT